jgi:hypothetical protein
MDLVREFKKAELGLDLMGAPLMATNRNIFQMDIRRNRGGERFRMWKGAGTNTVRVSDADLRRRQLILLVQEARRDFDERVSKRSMTREALHHALKGWNARILYETADDWIVERHTTPALRRFLCGMDESHLFIAQFDGGTTVKDAHRLLKPAEVRDAERSHAGRILRQGEWFFVPPGPAEKLQLAAELARRPWAIRHGESIGGNGQPHRADESMWLDGRRLYARGAIRHPDHRTLVLEAWHRVHRNAEVRQQSFGSNGVYWID